MGSQVAPLGSRAARGAAAIVSIVAWSALALRFDVTLDRTGDAGAAVWAMLRFFTIIANLFVALLFAGLALGRSGAARPSLIGAATLAILLVGVVFNLLLRGLQPKGGIALASDLLMHSATPLLVPLFWLAFAPKGRLRPGDPLRWAALPLVYFAYAEVRGGIEGRYPYFFMDPLKIGWGGVAVYALAMAAGFMAVGYALWGLDRRMGRPQARGAESNHSPSSAS